MLQQNEKMKMRRLRKIKLRKNKKAVSLMVAYVLLIVIAMAISILVYIWIKKIINLTPTPKCEEDTRLMILSYSCDSTTITLDVKNNGLFNVTGYIIRGGTDASKEAIFPLKLGSGIGGAEDGTYYFDITTGSMQDLASGESESYTFNYDVGGIEPNKIKKIEIQPFRIQDEQLAICEGIISEPVNCPSA